MHTYEVRPRNDHRGVDLISDALPFGRLLRSDPPIRVIRAIRGEVISAFPRRVFGKRDRCAKDPR
jgi:hypothetical protein